MAAFLAAHGVGSGDFVALFSDRDAYAVASIVAILKAGAAYVPMDPHWPRARTQALMADMKVRFIVAGVAQQAEAQRLALSLDLVRGVVCPARGDRYSGDLAVEDSGIAELFDYVVEDADPLRAAGFNVRGDERYQAGDLAAYRRHVAGLVMAAADRPRVLEIGCGSGEIADELLPSVSSYAAMDVSPVSVEHVEKRFGAAALRTFVGPAHRADQLVDDVFDVVLMASTVQFFPDLEYLYQAIEAALTRTVPGGRLLLCDLVDPANEDHTGLALPSEAFHRIARMFPSIAGVRILRRAGSPLRDRLAGRYDVELTVGEQAGPRSPTFSTGSDIADSPAEPPRNRPRADDIAYAIFTSGSTGRPKAVLVSHRSVVNLITWLQRTYHVGPGDRLLFVVSFCFDLSVFDTLGLLASGGYLRVADRDELDEPQTLIDLLVTERITIWDSAPAVMSRLTPFFELCDDLDKAVLRLVLLSGDWVPLSLPGEIQTVAPHADVVALGGATECTVWSNHLLANDVDPSWPSIPYGRPMDNARYYVLDDHLLPCPVDVAGDLYIGGDCVAVGYAGASALTAVKFMPDPWSPRPGDRMYSTGDLARWWPSGILEFLGRLDDQIKIRGFRIELGEIQAVLAQAPGVRSAVVTTVPAPSGKALAAFYLAERAPVDPYGVRRFLLDHLPSHMVPDHIVELTAFPMGPTGKVDRNALAALVSLRSVS
jgi:amino acid adenylation domain-containing protein